MKNVILHLGRRTFNVSLLDIDDGSFKLKATERNIQLGGDNFDTIMVNFLANRFQYKFKSDLRNSSRALRTLRTACERAKRKLSTDTQASIICDSIYDGHDLTAKITRKMFEVLNDDLFLETLNHVSQILENAKMQKNEITDIILIGGSSKIPRIQQMLHDFFNGKKTCCNVDPDKTISYGAIAQAVIINHLKAKKELEDYIYFIRDLLSNEHFIESISSADKDTIDNEIKNAFSWIESHSYANIDEFKEKYEDIKRKLMPIMPDDYHKYYQIFDDFYLGIDPRWFDVYYVKSGHREGLEEVD